MSECNKYSNVIYFPIELGSQSVANTHQFCQITKLLNNRFDKNNTRTLSMFASAQYNNTRIIITPEWKYCCWQK